MFLKTYVCRDCESVTQTDEKIAACTKCGGAVSLKTLNTKAIHKRIKEEERFRPRDQ